MAKPSQSKILVAMPAYNEERYIGSVILKARQYADKVIVLDDGSTDDTSEVARLAGATAIRHEGKKGKGAAIQSILAEAKRLAPDILVLLDADSQHNPEEIPRLIQPIWEGFDLIIGSRELQRSNIPLYRRIGQKVLLHSTLNPLRHGLGVLAQILAMISERRPLFFFGLGGSILAALGLIAGVRTVNILSVGGIMPTGTGLLSVLLLTIGIFSIFTGIILHALTRRKG